MSGLRLIPCLDVRDGRVVKGVRFADHADMGSIGGLAAAYEADGAGELVFYDISASPEGRAVDRSWIAELAGVLSVPFCVAGGIRSVHDAAGVLEAGAARISVNSPALERPALIGELAREFGSDRVVVGVDSLRDPDGEWRVRQYTGSPDSTRALARRTLDWIAEAAELGAGEIVLNCMGSDGVRDGYDIAQLRAARAVCPVPLIASGGAGTMEHFAEVYLEAGVDGALAASVFHTGTVRLPELRTFLERRGVPVSS